MAETREKRGTYQKSLARKERITRAVLDIVDESGHESVTTAGVAQATGIPEPSILYHFPTKDHLLVAAGTLADDELSARTGAESEEVRLDIETLRRVGVVHQQPNTNRIRLDTALRSLAMTPGHPAVGFIAKRNRRAARAWTRIVQRQQDDGLADPNLDPVAVAWQIISVLEGLTAFTLTEESVWAESGLKPGDLVADAILRLTGGTNS